MVGLLDIQNLVTCFVIIIGSGISGTIILRLLKSLVNDALDAGIQVEKQLKILDQYVQGTVDIFQDIGGRLSDSSRSSSAYIETLSTHLDKTKSAINNLGRIIDTTSQANSEVSNSVSFLQNTLEQISLIGQTSNHAEGAITELLTLNRKNTEMLKKWWSNRNLLRPELLR